MDRETQAAALVVTAEILALQRAGGRCSDVERHVERPSGRFLHLEATVQCSRMRLPVDTRNLTGLPGVDALAVARPAIAAPEGAVRGQGIIHDSRALLLRALSLPAQCHFLRYTAAPSRARRFNASPTSQSLSLPRSKNINRHPFTPYAHVNGGRSKGAIYTACRYTSYRHTGSGFAYEVEANIGQQF